MWDEKSRDGEGIAIKTTGEKLKKSFSRFYSGDVYIGMVEYREYEGENFSDSNGKIRITDWKNVHLHKPIQFEEESELRATVSILPTPEANPTNDFSSYSRGEVIDLYWSSQPTGVNIPIDKDMLIEEVCLTPYAHDWQRSVLEDVLKRYGVNAPVTMSKIFG